MYRLSELLWVIISAVMKKTSSLLFDFIHDFNLEVEEMGVCFGANVDFHTPVQKFNFYSEVHIESFSASINSIYLLNPLTEIYKIPTFFSDVNHQCVYFRKRGLFIAGYTALFGPYSISMFPEGMCCSRGTLEELRCKKLN